MQHPAKLAEDLAWYCLKSQPKHEHIAAAHLRKHAAVEVFAPMMRYQSVRGRRKVWNTEALFPCYLFARFNFEARCREICSSHAVRGIVHFGNFFPPVPDDLVLQLQATVDVQQTLVVPTVPTPGCEVTVIDGALGGLRLMVTKYLPAEERVCVLLEMLGRGVEIKMPVSAVVIDKPIHPLS